jgi:predicted nucleic acid-binding protein
MEQYLIDTNVICDYFSASFSDAGTNFMDNVINAIPNLSVITQIELLCWKTKATTEQSIEDFIADSLILNIGPTVIAECVKLRKGKKMKTPDAIIAATALANSYTLITNNERDFANIKRLKIINPNKM